MCGAIVGVDEQGSISSLQTPCRAFLGALLYPKSYRLLYLSPPPDVSWHWLTEAQFAGRHKSARVSSPAQARWGWRAWEFAVALVLISLCPSLRIVSVYGLLDGVARVSLGAPIGARFPLAAPFIGTITQGQPANRLCGRLYTIRVVRCASATTTHVKHAIATCRPLDRQDAQAARRIIACPSTTRVHQRILFRPHPSAPPKPRWGVVRQQRSDSDHFGALVRVPSAPTHSGSHDEWKYCRLLSSDSHPLAGRFSRRWRLRRGQQLRTVRRARADLAQASLRGRLGSLGAAQRPPAGNRHGAKPWVEVSLSSRQNPVLR